MDSDIAEKKEYVGDIEEKREDIGVISFVESDDETDPDSEQATEIEDEESSEESSDVLEENPPIGAVLGFRPSDYSATDFKVGIRIR